MLFHQAESKWVTEPQLVDVPKPGTAALGRIPSISEVVFAFTAITTGIGCHVFPGSVLSEGPQNSSGDGLDDQATNYLSAPKAIVRNLQDLHVRSGIVAALQRVNPSVSSVELDDIQDPSGDGLCSTGIRIVADGWFRFVLSPDVP